MQQRLVWPVRLLLLGVYGAEASLYIIHAVDDLQGCSSLGIPLSNARTSGNQSVAAILIRRLPDETEQIEIGYNRNSEV